MFSAKFVTFSCLMALLFSGTQLHAADLYLSSNLQQVETLYGINLGKDAISITVLSTGCTREKHFNLHFTNTKTESVSMVVVRSEPDRCKRMPFLKKITLSLPKKLQDKPLFLLNRFKVPTLTESAFLDQHEI